MPDFAPWIIGVVAGLAIIAGAFWLAFRPMLFPKPRPSGRGRHIASGHAGWNDTNHTSSGSGA
jgi:hypothetical protein